MDVFDFDNTIYDGESSFDFFKFCMRKKPSLVKHMPKIAAMLLKYKTGTVDKSEVARFCGEMLVVLAKNADELNDALDKFWAVNRDKLKPFMLSLLKEGDVIISASPSFMFESIKQYLNGADIIATEVDLTSMKIKTLCYGENKVLEFKKKYPSIIPDNYYTDNLNDTPMLELAPNAWLVKGEKIIKYTK